MLKNGRGSKVLFEINELYNSYLAEVVDAMDLKSILFERYQFNSDSRNFLIICDSEYNAAVSVSALGVESHVFKSHYSVVGVLA